MQKSEGVGILVLPGQPAREHRTFKCNHCDGVRPWTVLRCDGVEESNTHWCDVCDARVCGPCVSAVRDHRCVVWERRMEVMEARQRFMTDLELLTT